MEKKVFSETIAKFGLAWERCVLRRSGIQMFGADR